MKIRALSTFALAALLAAPVAFGDDKPSPTPAHGGRFVTLGDDPAARFEVVTDTTSGKMTLYAVPTGNTTVTYGSPVVLVGKRELRLTALPGETNAWTVTDAELRAAADARLRIRLGDRDLEGALIGTEIESVPTGLETRFEPTHGGSIVLVNERPFEWALEPSGGLTLYAIADAGHPAPLVSNVVFVPASGKELTFVAVKGETNAWRIEDPALTAAILDTGSLRFTIDGKPVDVRLAGHGKMKIRGLHGGHVLVLGDDAPALEMKRDLSTGLVSFWLIQKKGDTFADAGVTVTEPPTVEIVTASGPKTVKLTAVDGQTNAWTVTDPVFVDKKIDGTVKVMIDGKAYTTKLGWKHDDGKRDHDERGHDDRGHDDRGHDRGDK